MLVEGAALDVAPHWTQADDPVWVIRMRMMDRVNYTHRRDSLDVEISVSTLEELEDLVQTVRMYRDYGWTFDGLASYDRGETYAVFYKMVPWTEEEIKEAKDWLKANPGPDPLKPIVWRRLVPFDGTSFVIKEDKE